MAQSQTLASKEQSLFRQVIKCYEEKQYKRGLKSAELILKKVPRHGDTMAMKALILNSQGKKDEAFALAKEALQISMKSYMCWHVYGLLYRHHRNYDEAIKAYRFALKLEPESVQIQRDLAVLQIHTRDYAGYVQSRTAMLQARPALRQNWTALAVAHHLAGNLAQAENVLSTYEGTLKTTPPRGDYEHSEAVIYKNTVIAEQGDIERALEHLESIAQMNLDTLAVLERRAQYLAELGRKDEAAAAYRALLDRNPDYSEYYNGLLAVLGLSTNSDGQDDEATQDAKKAIFDEYVAKAPRSDAPRRLPLAFLTGDRFVAAAEAYVGRMLDKGVPSTFANLKNLYGDSAKKEALLGVVERYLEEKTTETESDDDKTKGRSAALYYLAQHYNYHLSRDLAKANEYLDQALAMLPHCTEFLMTRARILKHSGDLAAAAEAMNQARLSDKRDRYICSKTAKYMERNNQPERALELMGLFTRPDTPGGPIADLLDMQCIWFLTEDGKAYDRLGNVGMALKRFHSVLEVYNTWYEDQFDFHTFILRKGTVRAYVDLIRWEDTVRQHPTFMPAATQAAAVYVRMHDGRVLAEAEAEAAAAAAASGSAGDAAAAAADALERKKAAKRQRKEQQRLEREALERAAKQDPNKAQSAAAGAEGVRKVDDDPLGLGLAGTQDPLGEAMKFVEPLLEFSGKNALVQGVGFEVLMRRKKYVQALRCIKTLEKLDPTDPHIHVYTFWLRHELNNSPPLPEAVAKVLDDELSVKADVDLVAANTAWRDTNKGLGNVLAYLRVARILGDEAVKGEKLTAELEGVVDAAGSFEEVLDVEGELARWGTVWAPSGVKAVRAKAAERWPSVSVFRV